MSKIDIILSNYKMEKKLIYANGNNLDAIKFRLSNLKEQKNKLLEYIEQRELELIGMEMAINEFIDNNTLDK